MKLRLNDLVWMLRKKRIAGEFVVLNWLPWAGHEAEHLEDLGAEREQN